MTRRCEVAVTKNDVGAFSVWMGPSVNAARALSTAMSALCAAALAQGARAETASVLLPDLVPYKPERIRLEIEERPPEPARLLLRFDGSIHNVGPGVLEIYARHPKLISGVVTMTDVVQRAYPSSIPDGHPVELRESPTPIVVYEDNDDHAHFHLKDATRYSLVSERGGSTFPFAKTQAGFCLSDWERTDPTAALDPYYSPSYENFCAPSNPSARELTMGIQPGWRDVYQRELAFQWIDVSNFAPGRYLLESEPDPTGVITEANESNNQASAAGTAPVTLPGYVAEPQTVRAQAGGLTPILFDAQSFDTDIEGGTPIGRPEFRVVDLPSHGTLSVSPDDWTESRVVAYRPNDGFSGADEFTFAARDRDRPLFPTTPRPATVRLQVEAVPLSP